MRNKRISELERTLIDTNELPFLTNRETWVQNVCPRPHSYKGTEQNLGFH